MINYKIENKKCSKTKTLEGQNNFNGIYVIDYEELVIDYCIISN